MDEIEGIQILVSMLIDGGFPRDFIFRDLKFTANKKVYSLDLFVLSSDEKKAMIFEVSSRFRPETEASRMHSYLSAVRKRHPGGVELFLYLFPGNTLFRFHDGIFEQSLLPRYEDWDEKIRFFPQQEVSLHGAKDISSAQLTEFLFKTTENYQKLLTIKLLEDYFVRENGQDENVFLYKRIKNPFYFETNFFLEYQEDQLVFLCRKNDPDEFWRLFRKTKTPHVLIFKENQYWPLVDIKSQDIKIRKIVVDSPPLISFQGLSEILKILFFGNKEQEANFLLQMAKVGTENMTMLEKAGGLAVKLNSLPPNHPLRNYLEHEISFICETQKKLMINSGFIKK